MITVELTSPDFSQIQLTGLRVTYGEDAHKVDQIQIAILSRNRYISHYGWVDAINFVRLWGEE